MDINEQKQVLQSRSNCFKKITSERIIIVKNVVELIQNQTMMMFLKESLEELLDYSKV